ncbi:N-acetylmuramoyl-L-alanine amidase [Faecalicatena sp. AGMB00832]|uniref:N-acetylmuramoyl-L-alanine amidase n=1 Tax=Faecalicatena faecalis TaxID=2726362 RepID=A0ABS6D5N2_9FIRM|nr:N-acetylmuramoyl-L-alanine amidase [Faecalicatena faecalis]MBU3876476.1 N-acetylmuramoyl-L-alanine amidase [Faecalicatena faecalis]
MKYNYFVNHTTINFTSGNAGRHYIVLHYTGNITDSAKANANFFKTVYRGASAHLFVDDNDVYEVVALDDTAWAVGVDYGGPLFGVCTNENSINVEMCSVNGIIPPKTVDNAVELVRGLMENYEIPLERVVRHWDVCGKRCPGWEGWLPESDTKWIDFKTRIKRDEITNANLKERKGTTMQCFYTVDGKGPVIYFDGKDFHPLAHKDEMSVLNTIYKANNGKDMPCFNWSSKAPWYTRLKAAMKRIQ